MPRFPTMQMRSDGSEIPVAMTILPMRDAGGGVCSVVCIASGIGKTIRDAGVPSARDESHPPRHVPDLITH